jgi:hypothetical protein
MTEPVYYFQRGVGWIPTNGKLTITIPEWEIQVGDKIIGWIYGNGKKTETKKDYLVESVIGRTIRVYPNKVFHDIDTLTAQQRADRADSWRVDYFIVER